MEGRTDALAEPDIDERVEQIAHGSDLGWVASVLASERDAILRRWLQAASRQPFHQARSEAVVADHVPALFDALVALLQRSVPRWIDVPPPLTDPAVHKAATDHAMARFKEGLQPDELVTEFRLLRQEIGGALRTRLADAAPATDVIGAELVVHDALDGAISYALAALSSHIVEVRDEFLATTAHDVQQPLTGIKASLQLAGRTLRYTPPDLESVQRNLARAEQEVDRLATLVRTLADASRVALGRLETETTEVDLLELVNLVVARLDDGSAARMQVASSGIDRTGLWDALALDRVITNLVANALKYSPPDSSVRVQVAGEADYVELEVQDSGIGLQQDELPALFRRYSRTRAAVERHIPGIGLGLYLSHELVVALGGQIWAESEGRDRGATFHVRLPRHQIPAA